MFSSILLWLLFIISIICSVCFYIYGCTNVKFSSIFEKGATVTLWAGIGILGVNVVWKIGWIVVKIISWF